MNDSNLPTKILVIDDDPAIGNGLIGPMKQYKIAVDTAVDLDSANYLFNQNRYDVVLIENEFGPLPGLAFVQKWRQHEVAEKRCTGIIMLAGNKRKDTDNGLIKELGEIEVINKPFSTIQILPYLSRGYAAKKRTIAYTELKTKILDYYEKTGEFDKAAATVQKRLPELGPNGLNVLYDLYEKGERYEDALALVNGMLKRDGHNIILLNAKARLLMRLGKFAEARDAFEKADELAPSNIKRIQDMAETYLNTDEPDKAVEKYRELIALNPEDPDLKFEAYTSLYTHGFDDHAIAFGKQTAKPMEIVRHYNNKGVLMSKSGDGEAAIVEYERALKFFPSFKENYRIYFNIALALINQKTVHSYKEARINIEKCLKINPSFEKASKIMASIDKVLSKKKTKAS